MSEGTGAAAPGRGIAFSMLFPPGWLEFSVDTVGEERLTAMATAQAREIGRADVVLMIKQHLHRMFEGLRRRKAIGVHVPVLLPEGSMLPASLTVVPVRVGAQSTLAQTVNKLAEGVPVDDLSVDDTTWFRWIERHDNLEGNAEGLAVTIHYVIPRPGGPGEAGLHLLYAVVALAEDQGSDHLSDLETLGHTIIGTFQWREVA